MSFPLMPAILSAIASARSLTYLTNSAANTGITGVALPAAAADRFVIYVTSNLVGAVTMTSCTIGGIAAEIAVSGNASFACALVPTGTTADIVATYSGGGGSGTSYRGYAYAVYGLESPIWRSVGYNSAATVASVTLSVPAGGMLFAPVAIDNDGQTPVFSSPMVLDVEGDNGASLGYAGGHLDPVTAAQSYTATITIASGTNKMGAGVLR